MAAGRRRERWRSFRDTVGALAAVLVGVYLFNLLVQGSREPDASQVDAADAYVAARGHDYELRDCEYPLSNDDLTVHCTAETRSGRGVRLSFGYRDDGTVAVMCRLGTPGCR